MIDIEQILRRAEILFWEHQTYYHPRVGFLIYDQYMAVRDALEEFLPRWKGIEEFLASLGQLHDEVLGSADNTVFILGKDWEPSATDITNALGGERQRLQYTLSHILCHRIEGFMEVIHDRAKSMEKANRGLATRTAC